MFERNVLEEKATNAQRYGLPNLRNNDFSLILFQQL